MTFEEKWDLEEKRLEARMQEYELFERKAKELDEILPSFFERGYCSFVNHLESEMKDSGEKDSGGIAFLDYLRENWIGILKDKYPEILETIDLDTLYYFDKLLAYFFCSTYKIHLPRQIDVSSLKIQVFFKMISDYFDEFFGFEEEDYDELDRENWSTRDPDDDGYAFSDNDGADAVKKSLYSADGLKWDNIYIDFTNKQRGLFSSIHDPDIPPHKIRQWTKDFVWFSTCLLESKYPCNDRLVLFKEVLEDSELTIASPEVIWGEVLSFRTSYIYFVNYIEDRTDSNFSDFLTLSYLACKNIFDGIRPQDIIDEKSETDKLPLLYSYAQRKYEECKAENTCGIKLDCFPKDIPAYLLQLFPKHGYQFTPYYDAISPYVKPLTIKDRECVNLAERLINARLKRNDLRTYLYNTYKQKEAQDKYVVVYNKLYSLALMQEILYLVADAIAVKKHIPVNAPNVQRLCARIQDYLYEDYGYSRIEKEFDRLNRQTLERESLHKENMLYHRFIYLLHAELDPEKSLDEIFHIRSTFVTQLYNYGLSQEVLTLIEEVNQKVLNYIEDKVNQEKKFNSVAANVENTISKFMPRIKSKICRYYSGKATDYERYFRLFIRKLVTAELLYQQYVQPYSQRNPADCPEETREMDYSFIALEYYSALELLANILLYIPYRDLILQPTYDKMGEDCLLAEQGYVGGARKDTLVAKEGIKSALELGPLSYLYKGCRNSKNKCSYAKLEEYLKAMSLDIETASMFGRDLYEIKELRNEAAHGRGSLDIIRARKAQDVSYIHMPTDDQQCQINIADQCHAEIIKLLSWFSESS